MKAEKTLFKRLLPLLIALIVALTAAIAVPTLAYYIRSSNTVDRPFEPSISDNPAVKFTVTQDDRTISYVTITVPDLGYPIYVRVKILVTWQRAKCDCSEECEKADCADCENADLCEKHNPSVYFENPILNTHYTWESGSNWVQQGDYYYYTKPLKSDGNDRDKDSVITVPESESPVNNFELKENARPVNPDDPDDWQLNVEILVQTVQAVGHTDGDDDDTMPALKDAWGVDFADEPTTTEPGTTEDSDKS